MFSYSLIFRLFALENDPPVFIDFKKNSDSIFTKNSNKTFVKTVHTPLLSNIVAIIIATGQYKCHYIFFSTPSTLENIQYTKCAGRWGSHETKHNTRLQSECNEGSFVPKQAEKFQCNPVSLKWKVQMEWMDGWCPDVRSLAIQLDSGLCSVYTILNTQFDSIL